MNREAWYTWVSLFVNDPAEVRRRVALDPTLLETPGLWGETPMKFLAVENKLAAVRLALELGANANAQDKFGCTALRDCVSISTIENDNSGVVALLLAHGADPYHHTDSHSCAWHLAQEDSATGLIRGIFSSIPPPPTKHECCELMVGDLPDYDA